MDPVTTSATTTSVATVSFGFILVYAIFVTILAIVMIVALWRVFEKAGKPGWGAIVPFYNSYLLMEVAGYNGWLFLLALIPFVGGLVVLIMSGLGVAKNFGKSTVFGVFGLIIFSFIGYLMLGFGKAQYVGATAPVAAPPVPPVAPTTPDAPPAA